MWLNIKITACRRNFLLVLEVGRIKEKRINSMRDNNSKLRQTNTGSVGDMTGNYFGKNGL